MIARARINTQHEPSLKELAATTDFDLGRESVSRASSVISRPEVGFLTRLLSTYFHSRSRFKNYGDGKGESTAQCEENKQSLRWMEDLHVCQMHIAAYTKYTK